MLREISGGSTPKVDFPEQTPEEQGLQREQIDLLRDQKQLILRQVLESGLLAPDLYQAAGFEPITRVSDRVPEIEKRIAELREKANAHPTTKHYARDLKEAEAELALAKNEITGFRRATDPMDADRKAIEQGFLDRTLAAQRGELPADPALLRDLREQEQTLGNIMRRNLGRGWETSSPGTEALIRFGESANIQKDQARRQDLSLAEVLGISREQSNEQRTNQLLQRSLALAGRDTGNAAGLLAGANQYNPILASLFNNRAGDFQARQLNFQYEAYANPFTAQGVQRNLHEGAIAFLQSGGAQGAGGGGGGGGAAFSTAKVKKDFAPSDEQEALRDLVKTPVRRWRYKWEGSDRTPHIGPIVEESPNVIRQGEHMISLQDYLGLQHAGIKALAHEVETLRDVLDGKRRG